MVTLPLLLALALGAGCQQESSPSSVSAPAVSLEVGTEAEPVSLAGLQQRLAEEAARGRVVVVNYWATWCEPCREEFPELVDFQRKYAARGVRLLGVSLDELEERDSKVKEFLLQQKPVFPNLIHNGEDDPDTFINAIDPEWTGALPATFVYDRQGRRRRSLFGKQTLESLGAAVEPLL